MCNSTELLNCKHDLYQLFVVSCLCRATRSSSASGDLIGLLLTERRLDGRRKLAAEAGLSLSESLTAATERLESQGRTAVFAGWDRQVRGVLAVADTVKDGAAETIAQLHRMA